MKKAFYLIAALFSAALVSCSGGSGDAPGGKYLNVQIEDSKMWSLLDVDKGELVLTDEFTAPVSNVVDGAFFAKNSDGKWDIFTLDNTSKPLNASSFDYVYTFNKHGYAIAYINKHPACVVNTKGEIVTTFPTNIMPIYGFSDDADLAPFMNSKGDYGFLNPKGEIVIPATYENISYTFNDGTCLVQTSHKDGKFYYAVIDATGKSLFEVNSDQYSNFSSFKDGYAFAVQNDQVILVDKKGEKVCKVCDGKSFSNLEINGKNVLYRDGDFYGVKTVDGEIVIRAKYQKLSFIDNNLLLAENHNGKIGVINLDGDEVMPFDYSALVNVGNNRYITKAGSNYALINDKDKEVCKTVFEKSNSTATDDINNNTLSFVYQRSRSLVDAMKAAREKAEAEQTAAPAEEIDFSVLKEEEPAKAAPAPADNYSQELDAVEMPDPAEAQYDPSNANPYAWLSQRPVTPADLSGKSKSDLRVLRNAIYALHGYKFKSADLTRHFSQFSWYVPRYNDVTSQLSPVEKQNVEFIKRYE